MRVVVYSSSARGSGQFVRSLKLAQVVVANLTSARVRILVGNGFAPRPLPARTEVVQLPQIGVTRTGELVARVGSVPQALCARAAILEETLTHYRPDLFIVDTRPSGLAGELLDLLWRTKGSSTCVLVLALRDIVDSPERVKRDWEQKGYFRLLETLYDHILVFGNPRIYDFVDAYGLEACRSKVLQVGYLGSSTPRFERAHRTAIHGRILVTVGGGLDGAPVIQGVLEHVRRGVATSDGYCTYQLVLGPHSPLQIGDLLRTLGPARERVKIVHHAAALDDLITDADVAISMSGYNTLLELIEARKKIIAVPRCHSGYEQSLRARILSGYYDRLWVVPAELVATDLLSTALDRALRAPPTCSHFEIAGEANLGGFLRELAQNLDGRPPVGRTARRRTDHAC